MKLPHQVSCAEQVLYPLYGSRGRISVGTGSDGLELNCLVGKVGDRIVTWRESWETHDIDTVIDRMLQSCLVRKVYGWTAEFGPSLSRGCSLAQPRYLGDGFCDTLCCPGEDFEDR